MLNNINRKLVRKTLKKLDIKNTVIITTVPSYNCLEAIEQISPEKIIYLNVHNYDDSDRIVASILESEKALIHQSDFLFADSLHNTERLSNKSGGREIFRALPGVNFELFTKAYRGDEAKESKIIYFFGTIHDLVDVKLYNRLSKTFRIVFIGEITDKVKNIIADTIEIRSEMPQEKLSEHLNDADVIGLFYKKNAYTKGVIPAKIFESLATGKPVLVSGIEPDPVYSEHVYHFDGTEQTALEIMKNLPQTETPDKIKNRQTAAEQADWQKRFESFRNVIFSENKNLPNFSVLMSVYKGDRADYFKEAMDSIINQTATPNEVVLVKDGPLGQDLENTVNEYKQKLGSILKVLELKENKGLGAALAEGIKNCSFNIVARMDADDISRPQRFEKQLRFLKNNTNIDVVSCFISVFEENPEKPLFIRRGPLLHEKIAKKFKFRFCMNHAATMFHRDAVLKAGNYPDMAKLQDYYLWARMLLNGSKMANVGQILYCHRWQVERRSGVERAVQQIRLQKELLKIGFINKPQFVRNILVRSITALLPKNLIRKLRSIFGI
jgi:glycosyltransferase involved in cell wall biosynthesis